jgi:IS5 family transposase
VDLAREAGIELRQSTARLAPRLAPRLAAQVGRTAHAKQFRRLRKALRTLKGTTGRVLRDLRRQLKELPAGPLRERGLDTLVLVSRGLAPDAKGQRQDLRAARAGGRRHLQGQGARAAHEFGTTVSVATTLEGGFVVGRRALPGNPYDGHTLAEALEQVAILTDQRPRLAVVDRGTRGHGVAGTQVLISGTRRGRTPSLAAALRRRSAIEPEIGHMTTDGRLARCALKGTTGDALFAVLCGCGHNLRKILAHLRAWLAQILAAILGLIRAVQDLRYGCATT